MEFFVKILFSTKSSLNCSRFFGFSCRNLFEMSQDQNQKGGWKKMMGAPVKGVTGLFRKIKSGLMEEERHERCEEDFDETET